MNFSHEYEIRDDLAILYELKKTQE